MVKTASRKVYKTRNNIPESNRMKLIEILNARLADAFDLYSQAKQAHWNVKGPGFIALHELFDRVASETASYVDDLAERAVQLGGVAEGTVRLAAARSSLDEYPSTAVGSADHCEALARALASFGREARQAIDQAAALEDADTADLFTEISRGLDKHLWLVEAHLQAET